MRTIVDLPESQISALAKFCEKEKVSRAEAVRRAVDALVKNQPTTNREQPFGAWRKKRINSRQFVEKIRKEWK